MLRAVVLILILVSWHNVSADEIVWLRPDFPPGTFIDGPLKDRGYNDLARDFLIQRLPDYQHSVQTAGYERIVSLMKSHRVCIVGLYKSPERERFILYSKARGIILPNGLIIRQTDAERFAPYIQQGEVQLDQLLYDASLIGGVADGRLYKGPVDALLAQHEGNPHVLWRSGANVFSDLLEMLRLNRIDYTIGFPVELVYQQRLGLIGDDMQFIPIAGMPEATPTYIACSRNAWGEKVIGQINAILDKQRLSAEFLMTYQDWLDKGSRKRHQQLSELQFSHQSKTHPDSP